MRTITAADLFCGAGGTSTGLVNACAKMGFNLDLVAVNHWDIAISTHTMNHPNARHICAPIDSIKPLEVFPEGRLNLLVASPECTHFSNARGGKPMSDQRRATGWDVLHWLEKLYVDNVLIENVKEFRTWGPLGADGRPLKSKKGQTYEAFLRAIESLGYRVEDKVLNAANYGDPTTRERLFIIARRGNRKITWPKATHQPASAEGLFDDRVETWRSAREIIDWTLDGKSIFNRKKPLAPATLRRIEAGLRKFGGKNAEPFLVILRQHADAMSVDEPLPTLTAGGLHHGLVEPLIISIDRENNRSLARSLDEPVPTITGTPRIGILQPFIVPQFKENGPKSVDEPLGTLTTTSRGVGLCEPFLVPFYSENGDQQPRSHSVDEPLPTVPTKAVHGLVEPYLVNLSHMGEGDSGHDRRCYPPDQPMPTITGRGQSGVVEPVVMAIDHGSSDGNPRPVSEPLHTVTTKERLGVIQPIITPYYGNGEGSSVADPLPTVTTKDRFGLVEPYLIQFNNNSETSPIDEPVPTILTREKLALISPEGTRYGIDIRFRMLQPHELSKAMGFPEGYHFDGNREAVVKQIGNAVCVNMAEALCRQLLAA